MKKKFWEVMDYCALSVRIKQWYFEKPSKSRKILVFLAFVPFLLVMPLTRIHYKNRFVHEVVDCEYIYSLHKYENIKFFIPDFDTDIMQKHYFITNDFHDSDILPWLCEKYIKPNDVILDIGGNVGNHSIYFAKFTTPPVEIYTFEPNPHTYEILKKNLEINGLSDIGSNVHAYNCGLGAHEAYAELQIPEIGNSGNNQLSESETGDIVVHPLDSFEFKKVDFIKIDVEGFEYNVLLGGKQTLERSRPVIFLEIFPENYDKVNKLLLEYGYINRQEEKLNYRHDYIYIPR